MPTQIEQHFGAAYGDLALEYRVEDEPLGTGGGIGFAARGLDSTFLALNGDSLREADLDALVEFHRASGGKATIMLTPVADPSRYGLVRLAPDGRVRQFLEKPRPEEIDTNLINAGLYVLEPEVLDLIPEGRPVSIERDVFPRLCEEGSVFGLAQPGYWLDVGTPASYLQAHRDVLERSFRTEVGEALGSGYTLVDPTADVHADARLVPPVYVGPGAVLEAGVRAGSLAVVGAGARLGAGTVVENAVIAAGATIGEASTVIGSIVGADARLGAGCTRGRHGGGRARRNARLRTTTSTTGCASVPEPPSRRRRCASHDPLPTRATPDRQAVGLGAHLGRGRAVRRQAALRPRRAVAQPAVPRAEGRVVARARGACDARARGGRRSRWRPSRSAPATPSASAPGPCTVSPPSRTRWCSRCRRRTSTTSCGSRTATGAPTRPPQTLRAELGRPSPAGRSRQRLNRANT